MDMYQTPVFHISSYRSVSRGRLGVPRRPGLPVLHSPLPFQPGAPTVPQVAPDSAENLFLLFAMNGIILIKLPPLYHQGI